MRVRYGIKGGAESRRGVALIYAVFGSFVVAAMVAVMFTMAGASDARADVRRGQAKARMLADGALSVVERDLRSALASWQDPVPEGTKVIGGHDVHFRVRELGVQQTSTDASGIARIVQPYELEASTKIDGARETARTIVNVEWMPLFQFAVFYGSDLEIHAGPDLTLRGRVHSNGDMYLGGGSTITLDTNYVRAVGDIRRSKKDGTPAGGNVDIRRYVDNPFDTSVPTALERMLSQAQFTDGQTVSGYDSAFREGLDLNGDGDFFDAGEWLPFEFGASQLWGADPNSGMSGQTVMTGQHGVTQAMTPDIGSIHMYDETRSGAGGDYRVDSATGEFVYDPGNGTHNKGHFYENAGLSLVVQSNGTLLATNAEGVDVTAAVASAVAIRTLPDTRQSGGSTSLTSVIQVDMAALAATGHFPSNGLVYGAHASMGEGAQASGLMLTNGSELSADLTVASNGPVYVHGDYNTTDKKSAAVIGDAVNLLSNAWDGSKTPGTLPSASETTYNFAMITGSYESTENRYNGGLENLPRFHENWTGVPCNIAGSFVNIFDSEYATGDWVYGGDRYTAPIRNWQYDPLFNSLSDLPPFTPMAVTAGGVVTW